MDEDFDVTIEYKKDRNVSDENKYFLIGMAIMIVAAILDWGLFQWFYSIVKVGH